jgi:hypothetical protein
MCRHCTHMCGIGDVLVSEEATTNTITTNYLEYPIPKLKLVHK